MNDKQQFGALDDIIDEAGIGVLATVDSDGRPHMRWMTAGTEKSRPGAIFCVSHRDAGKISQIESDSHVQWLFSSGDRTATVNGQASIVDNPAVHAGVIELLGGRLERFWKQGLEPDNIVVLETIIGDIDIQ